MYHRHEWSVFNWLLFHSFNHDDFLAYLMNKVKNFITKIAPAGRDILGTSFFSMLGTSTYEIHNFTLYNFYISFKSFNRICSKSIRIYIISITLKINLN